ncbi:MAG TPA: tripartite tricarboxylate transporter substrate binding protein, partial [Burkholderiales bacterium]|nr:tripartite tricarboxylate transporter substrate binding protein [Burkholderiales bacterium]
RILVPFPPGGANDIVARVVGQKLYDRWGKPAVIDNRGGAGGNIGTEMGARAAPDGYTLLMGSGSTLAANVGLYAKLPFDPRTDFAPISLIAVAPYVLIVNNAVPATTVQQLVQLAKSRPRGMNYSSFGEGSSAHLIAEDFKHHAGVDITHIPYKGGGPALAAVMGGEVQVSFSNLSVALPQVRAGKVRALMVTTKKRSPAIPELGTPAECGLPDFEASAWVGLLAPAGTPRALVMRLNRDVHQVVDDAASRKQLAEQGLDAQPGTPEALAQLIRVEIERYTKVIKQAGIKPQ